MVRFLSTELSVHVSVPVSLCVHDITWHIRCSSYWWRVSHRRWRRMQAAEPPPAHKRSLLHGRARPSNVHTTAAHEPAPAKNTEALRRSLQLSSKLNYSTQLMLATPHPTPPHLRTYSPTLLSLSLPHFQPLLFSPWILLLTLSIKGKDFQSLITSTRKETWRTRRQTDGRTDRRFFSISDSGERYQGLFFNGLTWFRGHEFLPVQMRGKVSRQATIPFWRYERMVGYRCRICLYSGFFSSRLSFLSFFSLHPWHWKRSNWPKCNQTFIFPKLFLTHTHRNWLLFSVRGMCDEATSFQEKINFTSRWNEMQWHSKLSSA